MKPLYRKKELIIAEQFLPEDGKIPLGVYETAGRQRSWGKYAIDLFSETVYLISGDYICEDGTYAKWVDSKEEFESRYELVQEGYVP